MRFVLLTWLALLASGHAGAEQAVAQQVPGLPASPVAVLGRPQLLDDPIPVPASLQDDLQEARFADISNLDMSILQIDPRAERPRDPARWQGEVELGLNAAHGNTSNSMLFNRFEIRRATEWGVLSLDWDYVKSITNKAVTEHHALLDVSHQWMKEEERHGWFASFGMEYDEFRAFDLRTSFNGGRLISLLDQPDLLLVGRIGAGVSQEIGGLSEALVPEAILGLRLEHNLTRWQRITIGTEYYPDWRALSEFRLEADASWEIVLNERRNFSFKLTALDRYDSTPQGRKHNDFDYAMLFVWKF